MISTDSTYEQHVHSDFRFRNSGAPVGRLPSLKALRAFDAVARLKSVTAAAEELCVTPSAVSRQISSLEDDVGVELLRPDGRGCCLTADGRLLESGLEGVFGRIAEAVDRVRRPSRGTEVRVRVGVMFAAACLIPLLDRFNRVAPSTEVVLVDMTTPAEWNGQADIVIDWGVVESDATTVVDKLTSDEEIFPVCGPGVCRDGSLAGATFLSLARGGEPWHWPDWPEFLAAVGLSHPGGRSHRLSAALLLRAVRNGRGVALSCSTLARNDLRSGALVRPIAESMATEESYWMRTSRTALDRREIGTFRSWLLDEFAAGHGEPDEDPGAREGSGPCDRARQAPRRASGAR